MKILLIALILLSGLFVFGQIDSLVSNAVYSYKDTVLKGYYCDSVGTYVDGSYIGRVNWYNKNDKLVSSSEHKAESPGSIKRIWYHPNGKLAGEMDSSSYKMYYKNGNLSREHSLTERMTYYKNGKIKQECTERDSRNKKIILLDCIIYARNGKVLKKYRISERRK